MLVIFHLVFFYYASLRYLDIDFTVMQAQTAEMQRKALILHIRELIRESNMATAKLSIWQRYTLWLIRIVVNSFIIGILGGCLSNDFVLCIG